jgi:MFS family permease
LFVVILGYHATAAVFTLATVFALAILEFDGNKSSWRVIILIMALVAALVAVWTATGLMGSLINRILNGVSFAFESQTDLHHVVPLWETWMNSMPVYLFFCLSYLGLLYFFKNKGKHRSLSILVAILMGLTLVGTLNIDAARMLVYVAFFASVAIGVSLVFIVRKAPKKFTPVALTALVFVLVVSSSMIPIVNYDNREPFPNIAISYALTESEMTAGGFSGDNNYNKIYTDTLYQYASQYLYGSFSRNTDYNLDSIEAGTYVVIRKYITENRAYVNETATSALAGLYPTMYGDGTMAVYDNGYVAHYLRV